MMKRASPPPGESRGLSAVASSLGNGNAGVVLLALTAGFVDAACYLGLSEVFTAHVTGNIATIASAVAPPTHAVGLRIEVLVAFAIGVFSVRVSTRSVAHADARSMRKARRRVLTVEAVWLLAFVGAWYALGAAGTHETTRDALTLFAGGAMGAQSTLPRLPGKGPMSRGTTFMTSNYTQWAMSLTDVIGDLVKPTRGVDEDAARAARHDLAQLSLLLAAFVLGAMAGAESDMRFGLGVMAGALIPLALVASATLVRDAAPLR